MEKEHKRVGLLSHVWGGNLGDEGSLDAVIQNIKARWPWAEMIGLSMNPDDTRTRHGIAAYAIRREIWSFESKGKSLGTRLLIERIRSAVRQHRLLFKVLRTVKAVAIKLPGSVVAEIVFLTRAFRVVRSLDLLVISGGGQLIESSGGPWVFLGGPWRFPYSIYKWVFLAQLAHVKSVMLNVGAGPLVTRAGRYFVKKALRSSDYVSFRDEESVVLARQVGFRGECNVFPDSAYSLKSAALEIVPKRERNQVVVGLAPMAFGDPRLSAHHDRAVYEEFVCRLGSFVAWLRKMNYRVTLFCSDIGIDPPVIEDLQKLFNAGSDNTTANSGDLLCRVHQWTSEELLRNMSAMDYVVVCRFHAVVFAHMLNIPTLAISYHPKVMALMNELGLGKYCVPIEDCELDPLIEAFTSLVENRLEVKGDMARRLIDYRRKLEVQFDGLFPSGTQGGPNRSGFLGTPLF